MTTINEKVCHLRHNFLSDFFVKSRYTNLDMMRRGENMKRVDAKTLKSWLDSGEVILIDVRTHEEYEEAAIPGALHIPLSSFDPANLSFSETSKKVVIHCRSGMRSAAACSKLLEHTTDFDVYNLDGGILAWIKEGYVVLRDL